MFVQIQEQEEHAVNYQPILSGDKKDEYWVVIVLRFARGWGSQCLVKDLSLGRLPTITKRCPL